MRRNPHQTVVVPNTSQISVRRQPTPIGRDQLFRLPTVLARNDPFIRRLHSVVVSILDDHPYPRNAKDFRRRTSEISTQIEHLHLPKAQVDFLRTLTARTNVTLVDLWQGSHVVVLDRGKLYDRWSRLPSARPRISSHYRQVPTQQYGISFRDHQLLFGKTAIKGSTWFQMEAHGFDLSDICEDPDQAVYHGQDFLKYRFHRMNVGPFGFSPHTETEDPIVLPYRPPKPRGPPPSKHPTLHRFFL